MASLATHWQRRTLVARLLWPASMAFRALVFLRRWAYRLRLLASHRVGIPVVVVGNVVAGGSGKTPLVLWVARFLARRGWKPGIVSRGYGARVESPRAVTIVSQAAEVGDEPVLLARRSGCPVWVGPDRVAAIAAMRAASPEVNVVVLDDGLQHYRLERDLEVAVVDARLFGNGWMIPAGPLREPPARLRSVDAVVTNATSAIPGYAMRVEGEFAHRLVDATDRRPLAAFRGQRVRAIAGIGEPRRFFALLSTHGVTAIEHPFPDHHPLRPADLAFDDDAPVLMTEKDAVKLCGSSDPRWWVVPVEAELDPAFGEWLATRLASVAQNNRS